MNNNPMSPTNNMLGSKSQRKKLGGVLMMLQIALIALSVVSIFVTFFVTVMISKQDVEYPIFGSMYFTMKNMWLFWAVLPIPVATIIFGTVMLKKNYDTLGAIITGAIVAFLLVGTGMFFVIANTRYSTSNEFWEEVSEDTGIDFPDDMAVLTENLESSTTNENYQVLYISTAIYSENTDISSVIDGWSDTFDKDSTTKMLSFYGNDYDRYLIKRIGTYAVDKRGQTEMKPLYIAIAVNFEKHTFIAFKYYVK